MSPPLVVRKEFMDERIAMKVAIDKTNLGQTIKELMYQVEQCKKEIDTNQAKINEAMIGVTRNEGAIWECDRIMVHLAELQEEERIRAMKNIPNIQEKLDSTEMKLREKVK